MKILIGCNLLTSVNSLAYPNHMQFWYNLGKRRPQDEFIFFSPRRMSIDRMRNEAAKIAMEQECDYLFFYDDDVLLPDDALDLLLGMEKGDVRAGVTLIRSAPFDPMVFKYNEKGNMVGYPDFMDDVGEDGIVAADAVGFSCCLINVNLLLNLQPPFFVTGPNNTEDVYFCHKVNEEKSIGLIYVNTKVVTGHILDPNYVSPGTKKPLQQLDDALNEMFTPLVPKDPGDRDADYRERVLARLYKAAQQ